MPSTVLAGQGAATYAPLLGVGEAEFMDADAMCVGTGDEAGAHAASPAVKASVVIRRRISAEVIERIIAASLHE